ncbi:unnamed protein product [Rotaria sordida]|uniref:Cupin type-2 domain-containing protein n=1 Tax=Rotaria sordida TaxID=392033 RepID=A0A814D8D7_9BILA|nr:unnamed protein product [Rotaria sordida]CAF0990722.1 unnamed protein product [Rotaria sordida]
MIYMTFIVNSFFSSIEGILPYTTLVTFGDSTTDSGNAYRLSNRTWPPVPPFNQNGGFADGLLWNEYFTQKLLTNATLYDYACGSATTDNQLAQGIMSRNPNLIANYDIRSKTKSPGVRQQILQYKNSIMNQTIDFNRTLYVIWSGTNNYFFNKTLTIFDTVQSIIDCLNLLISFGGQNLVLITEPPFHRFPAFRNKNETNTTKYLYIEHNQILNMKLNEYYSSLKTQLNIQLFDSYSFISMMIDNYTQFGFENLDSCWDTISGSTVQVLCQNITKRIFCDEYHLTSKMQAIVAEEFYRFLTEKSNATDVPKLLSQNNVSHNGSSSFANLDQNLKYFMAEKLLSIAEKLNDGKLILPVVVEQYQGEHLQVLARANSTRTIKLQGSQTDGRLTIMEGEILVGEAPPLHIHHREDEYFHVLQGELQFEIGDQTFIGKAGTWVYAPRYIKHRFRNINSPGARLEYVFQPAGIEHYFEEVSKIMVEQQGDWESAAKAVATKYGIDMLGSPDWTG